MSNHTQPKREKKRQKYESDYSQIYELITNVHSLNQIAFIIEDAKKLYNVCSDYLYSIQIHMCNQKNYKICASQLNELYAQLRNIKTNKQLTKVEMEGEQQTIREKISERIQEMGEIAHDSKYSFHELQSFAENYVKRANLKLFPSDVFCVSKSVFNTMEKKQQRKVKKKHEGGFSPFRLPYLSTNDFFYIIVPVNDANSVFEFHPQKENEHICVNGLSIPISAQTTEIKDSLHKEYNRMRIYIKETYGVQKAYVELLKFT